MEGIKRNNKAEFLAIWLHNCYENLAQDEGWNTQTTTQVNFDKLPPANRRVMLRLGSKVEILMRVERDKVINQVKKILNDNMSCCDCEDHMKWDRLMTAVIKDLNKIETME